MKTILMSICCLFAVLQSVLAQDLTLTMPDKLALENESVSVDILTLDFDSIVSTQFSIAWDPTVIAYDNTEIGDLDLVAVGSTNAASGSLRLSWFDIDGEGKSLADGQIFLRLKFTTVGQIGDVTPVLINGDSLEIQIFKATDTPFVFDAIDLLLEDGSVEIVDEEIPQNTFEITNTDIQDVLCTDNETGAINLESNQDNVSYNWSGPNGFFSTMQNIENLFAGDYQLTILDAMGTLLFDTTFMITQPPLALEVLEIMTTASACAEASGSAEFDVVGGAAPYEFALQSGMQFSQNNVPTLSSGDYPVTITDANGCIVEARFTIGQLDTFAFSLGQDINACIGEPVEIAAGDFASYLWSDMSTNDNIAVNQPGQYAVTVTNVLGCTASDTISLEYVEEIKLQVSLDNITICPGDSVTLSVTGGVSYEWIDPTNALTDAQGSTVIVKPNENNIYTVISESTCGSDEIEIPVSLYRIAATAGQDVCVPVGQSTMLNASGGSFYYWSGSEYPLSAYDIPNPSVTPEDSTQFFVMIVDDNQCTTFDTLTVFVADDPVSFIPHINLITPNGDGQNDVVDFGSIDKFGANSFRVFNRWGKIVYEKINYQSDGDRFSGIFNGKQLPAGNYYYILSFVNDQQIKQTLCIVEE